MSTKEEALKKAMELKEEVRVRGDDLQQMVEEAVRKAFGETLKEEMPPRRSFAVEGEYPPDRRTVEEIPDREKGHTLQWYKGINSIAVNIKLKMGEGKKGTILFSSSVSGEGTTTICSSVARALSKVCTGNVLLIDCNAQNPEIHKIFNTAAVPGLTDVLYGKVNWEDAVRKSSIKNFFILPFGQSVPESLALFGSESMEGLLNTLKTTFDYICLDVPPILGSGEAEIIVQKVETSVLIVKAQATRREVVMRAAERMVQYKDFMGAVINQQEFIIPQFLYKRLK